MPSYGDSGAVTSSFRATVTAHDRQQLTFTTFAMHSAVQALVGATTSAAGRTAFYLGATAVEAELARWAS
jgi:hypothetical protein